jgi:predicted PurR-regulated permease PerM
MSDPREEVPPEVIADSPIRDRLLMAILVILVFYTLSVAAPVIVPVLVALLLSLMLAPAVRVLAGLRLPRIIATILVMVTVLVIVVGLLTSLANPAREWLSNAPRSMAKIEQAARSLQQPLRAATEAGERLAELTEDEGTRGAARVVEAAPSQTVRLLRATPGVLATVLVTVILTFIFLLHGDLLLRKLVEIAPELRVKKEIVQATRSAQHDLSVYVLSITVINIALGAVTAAGLWWLGVPNPLLWGGVAALLNYAPYIGPAIMMLVLTVVGFGHYDTPFEALTLPGLFLLLNILEGQLFTPLTVGKRLALDPIVVFIGLVVLGWLWGIVGVLLALPLLTCLRIVAERVSGWETVAKILRRPDLPAPAEAVAAVAGSDKAAGDDQDDGAAR